MGSNDALNAPAAPAPGTALCTLAELEQTGTRGLTFRDESKVFMMFVVRTAGGAVAFVNSCPHLGTPLNFLEHRFLTADRTRLQCATHGAQFEPETGLCVHGPCLGARLKQIDIVIDGETVRIAAAHG